MVTGTALPLRHLLLISLKPHKSQNQFFTLMQIVSPHRRGLEAVQMSCSHGLMPLRN